MKSQNKDSRIDDYINTLPVWQREVFQNVRNLIHEAEPEIIETIKRTSQPYFILSGNVCALLGTKDHVNVFIYDPTVHDPDHIINQGHNNLTAKAIQIYEGEILKAEAFKDLVKRVVRNNKRGGWRKLNKL